MKFNVSPINISDRRANALKKLERLRMKRKEEMPKSGSKQKLTRIPIPPTPPTREVNLSTLTFLFEKRLKYSDINDLGRIVIPKGCAEKYLPPLESKEGHFMFMDDITEVKIWRFKYRFWPNNASRVYVLENTGEFAKARQLKIGDFMMVYKDDQTQRFAIGVRRSTDNAPEQGGGLSSSSSLPVVVQGGALEANNDQQLPFFPPLPPTDDVPEVVGSSSSSYSGGLQDFPMDLLDMDDIEDLPEY